MGAVEAAYPWFFRAQFPTVTRTVFLIVNDRAVAEDVTQRAFTQLLRHWDEVATDDVPEAWVRKAAIRRAVRRIRRERLRPGVERPGVEQLPGADGDVLRAVAALPVRQRVVVVLSYYEDRPVPQVADILGVSERTVRTRLHRALRRLAETVREEAPVHAC